MKESTALAEYITHAENNVAVSFSGGKDSLVVLDLAERVGIKRAVFCDTTIEFDETVEYVRQIRNYYNIKIDIVKPPISFFEMIQHVGIPSRKLRWCCEVFKFAPLANYARKNDIFAFITGLRRAESNTRSEYTKMDNNPLVPVPQINPIVDWSSKDVWEYIHKYNLPYNPLYEHFSRMGCWCCPYKSKSEWETITRLFPEKVERLEAILYNYAEKAKIKDKEKFVKRRGWIIWSGHINKVTIGSYSPCHAGSDYVDLIFTGENEKQVEKIRKILSILTDDFFVFAKKLRVTISDLSRIKLNILVEKAINCVACGACTSVCRVGALYIDSEGLCVDKQKCIHCGDCINTSILKGGCIMRNYSMKRQALISL